MTRAPLPELRLSLQFADSRHRSQLPRHKVQRWIRHALETEGEITVRIVGAEEARELNRSYRGKDYATNVLTFDYDDDPVVLADLVPTCWCTAPCMLRVLTTRTSARPRPWRRARPSCCWVWVSTTRTAARAATPDSACAGTTSPGPGRC